MKIFRSCRTDLFVISLVLVLVFFMSACASSPDVRAPHLALFQPGHWVVLRTNLHPNQRGELSALNHQPQNVLPMCTEALILEIDQKGMKFRIEETDYVWQFSDQIQEDSFEHLLHFFAPRCERRQLSELDQLGIKQGSPKVGMTRRGVFYAMGFPPDDVTPDSSADVWIYWCYKDVQRKVFFENDVVVKIE